MIGGEDGNGCGGPGFWEFCDEACGDPRERTRGVSLGGFSDDVLGWQLRARASAKFSEMASGCDICIF